MGKKRNRRDDFLALIDTEVRSVLDLGCGDGSIGGKLVERGKRVVGVEKGKVLCDLARKKLSEVFEADLDKDSLPFAPGSFDLILCADVLEHLVDPLRMLEVCRSLLSSKGVLLASIPNVRYYKVLKMLLFRGTWDYMDTGILDRTHLRFYTLTNVRELFWDAGYDILKIERNVVASRLMKVLNALSCNRLSDFVTYQYYVKVRPASRLSRERSPGERKKEVF